MPSSRAEAWATLNEFTKSPHLIKHGLGVESAMRQYAPKYGGEPEVWFGSADMMHRNLDRRVEALVQVKDPKLTAYLNDLFESALDPSTRCWELESGGQWIASPREGHTVRDHQESLMERHRSA